MNKHAIAGILDEIGILLELKDDNPFKVRAYRTGARALETLEEDLDAVIACDVMRPPPRCLTPGQPLLVALPAVLESELRNVPVVNNRVENKLVCAVIRAEVLAIFSEAITAKSDPSR